MRLMAERVPSFPAYSRQRFENAVRTRRHLDIPLMQRHQRRTMADRDNRRVRQDLAQHAVDFRFQLLVERRCRLIEKQPIRLVENSPRDRQTLLLATGKTLGPVVFAVDFAGERRQQRELQSPAHGLVTMGFGNGGVGHRGLQSARGYVGTLWQQ